MFEITPDVGDQIVACALRERPHEACGMVSAGLHTSVVDEFHPLPNAAESATRFVIDPASMLDLEHTLEASRRVIVGVVHSHPATSPYPSPTDIADSTTYDPDGTYVQLLVSLHQPEPSLRAFRVVNGAVTELRLVVVDPAPTAHDGSGAMAKVARMPQPGPPAD